MARREKAGVGEMRIEYVALSELRRWPRNPKGHALELLDASFARFGFVKPLMVDEGTGRLVAGHGRLEALEKRRAEGKPPPERVQVRADGEWLVPVQRGVRFSSEAEARAYLLADNRTQELGGWVEEDLARVLAEVGESGFEGTGYTGEDLEGLLATLAQGGEGAGEGAEKVAVAGYERAKSAVDGDVPEVVEEPSGAEVWVRPGQLYALGPHRVLCGDSLTPELNRALAGLKVQAVIEDPPYAIYGSSTGVSSDIADWEMVLPFFESVLRRAYELLPLFGHAYVFCDWRSFAPWVIASKRVKMALRNKLVWDKGSKGMGTNWGNTYEEVAYFAKLPLESVMQSQTRGVRKVLNSNMLRYPRPTGDEREHNSAKPVALLRELVTASTDKGGVVLDMFCGSGSTLVACEAEGRVCVTADKEPRWVQVAIERWQRYTGGKAELVGE